MKHGNGCIEQLIIDEGFTSIPNIILRYSKELELDYSDIGILSLLTYIKHSSGKANESTTYNTNNKNSSQDLLRRAERLNLIEVSSIETLEFSFSPLLEQLSTCIYGDNKNSVSESAENIQTTEYMMTKMQKDLCEKDKQIRELEQQLKGIDTHSSLPQEPDNSIKNIFAFMEQALGRLIDNSEVEAVSEWINTYGFEEETVLLLLEEMYAREKTRITYIEKVARDWYQQGIHTKDDALRLIQAQKAKTGLYGRIGRYISLEHNMTVPEMHRVDRWINEYGFTEEIIMKACDQTVGSRKPSIGYIDTILGDWASKGLKSVENIDEHIKTNKINKKKTTGTAPVQAANQTKQKDWEDFREYEEYSRRQGFRKNKA